jgi:hypothetical protein
MQSSETLNKFLGRINDLIDTLTKEKNSVLQRGVDPYYYIQKREELKLLQERADEAVKKIEEEKQKLQFYNQKLNEEYRGLFNAWRKDARWVYMVLRERDPKPKSDNITTIL